MGVGLVGVLRVDLHLPEGGSVEGKRREIPGVKTRLARDVAATMTVVARDVAESAAGSEYR